MKAYKMVDLQEQGRLPLMYTLTNNVVITKSKGVVAYNTSNL